MNKTTTFRDLRRQIKATHKQTQSWRKTAVLHNILTRKGRPNPSMAWRIAKKGYDPPSPWMRDLLGLPTYKLAPSCEHCGEVHVSMRCPKTRTYLDLFGMPIKLVLWKLANRENMD